MAVFSQKELKYLREQWLGRLATISKGQIPYVTPVAFATDGERVYLNLLPDSKKIRNIRENRGFHL